MNGPTAVAEEISLFERIGGREAVDAAVDIFYDKVLADPTVSYFFEGANTAHLRNKQKAFLTFAFGGPARYNGQSLRAAHEHLVERGLNHIHFDTVAGHLLATVQELGVPALLVNEIMAIAASTRNDVLGK